MSYHKLCTLTDAKTRLQPDFTFQLFNRELNKKKERRKKEAVFFYRLTTDPWREIINLAF